MVALAVYNGIILDLHMPRIMFKKLLHRCLSVTLSTVPPDPELCIDDIRDLDPDLYKGLKQLLDYSPADDVEEVFCRTFEVTWEEFGITRRVDLIPDGSSAPVDGSNRQLYVEKYIGWLLVDSVSRQFDSFFSGFCRVIPPSSMLLFRPEELELLVCGTPQLDFSELERTAEYEGGSFKNWNKDHSTIRNFWEVLHSFSLEQKQKFLMFTTGSSRAPLGGLAELRLKIQRMGPNSNQLPTAHTCFNTLLLPDYKGKDKLRERLTIAINETEGFGLK